MLSKKIAEELGVSESQVKKWKSQDKWDKPKAVTKRKGAQFGNQNAVGNFNW